MLDLFGWVPNTDLVVLGRFLTNLFHSHFFFLIFILFYFIFKLYNIALALPNIETNPRHRHTRVPHPEPSTLLPPPHSLGRPSAPAPSLQYRASNPDWRPASHMIRVWYHSHFKLGLYSVPYSLV